MPAHVSVSHKLHPMPPSKPQLTLGAAGPGPLPQPHLSVDGMTPAGPNLSHWPGNRTPVRFKADLSTGICLAFARADAADQLSFLDGATVTLNDHFDTDGFLSLLAVLRPEVALAREEVCLAAAATGDFQAFVTTRGYAINRIVERLAKPESPVAHEFAGITEATTKDFARYRWLMDHAESVLDEPEQWSVLWEEPLQILLREFSSCRQGGMRQTLHRDAGFAVIETTGPLSRMALNTVSRAYRVLHVEQRPEGRCFRYHDRTESWFDVATYATPQRRDLREAARALQKLEGEAAGAARWIADASNTPVPEIYFGPPSEQEYGHVTRELLPSRLDVDTVAGEFLRLFSSPPAAITGRDDPDRDGGASD